MSENNRIVLTAKEAIKVLPDGDEIHTFTGGGAMIFGADWSRKEAIKTLKLAKRIELAGKNARSMGHGLAVFEQNDDLYFLETNEDKLKELENAKKYR